MKIIGHRGARGLAPGNTLASLQKAFDYKVDEIEFDLRVTKDNVVVLHHDPYLTRGDGSKTFINKSDFSKLKKLKPDLTTFEQAIDSFFGKIPFYIEVKPNENIKPILKIIKGRGLDSSMYRLASFSQKTLLDLHRALPGVDTIVIEKWSGIRASRRAKQLNTKYVCMNQKWLWWGFIRVVARSNTLLYAYTVDDPIKAKKWAKHGLYGVVTDRPDLFR